MFLSSTSSDAILPRLNYVLVERRLAGAVVSSSAAARLAAIGVLPSTYFNFRAAAFSMKTVSKPSSGPVR